MGPKLTHIWDFNSSQRCWWWFKPSETHHI